MAEALSNEKPSPPNFRRSSPNPRPAAYFEVSRISASPAMGSA